MIKRALHESHCPQMIRILTFTVMGVKMGVDTEQIGGIWEVDEARRLGTVIHYFHEKIFFRDRAAEYHAPKAMLVKDGDKEYSLVIDNPDDIIEVGIESIQPLPSLIALPGTAGAFWGAVANDQGIVLLVDFSRMKNGCMNKELDAQAI